MADAVNHTLLVGGQEGGGLDEKQMTQLLKNQVYLISSLENFDFNSRNHQESSEVKEKLKQMNLMGF